MEEEKFKEQMAAVAHDLKDDAHVSDFGSYFTVVPNNRPAATKVSNYLLAKKIPASVDMTDAPVRPIFSVFRPAPPSSCIIL